MNITPNTLPAIMELSPVSITFTPVPSTDVVTPEGTVNEINAVISGIQLNPSDEGLDLSFSDLSAVVSGSYTSQFNVKMSYTEPQIERDASGEPLRDPEGAPIYNSKLPLVQHDVNKWSSIPEPGDIENVWYLYKFKPPAVVSTSVSFTVSVDWVEETIPAADAAGVVGDPTYVPNSGSFNVSQVINWDMDTNVAQFRKYYPEES